MRTTDVVVELHTNCLNSIGELHIQTYVIRQHSTKESMWSVLLNVLVQEMRNEWYTRQLSMNAWTWKYNERQRINMYWNDMDDRITDIWTLGHENLNWGSLNTKLKMWELKFYRYALTWVNRGPTYNPSWKGISTLLRVLTLAL